MIRPVLSFKPTCPPCRWMSATAVLLSLGHVRRVAVTGDEARALYDRYPAHRGQLVLEDGDRAWFQRQVFLALPLVVVRTWGRAARAAWRVLWPA